MDETRERLLAVAGEVFAAKGFEAATVRQICTQAEANIAAVNYHFGDKERLYIEAVKHAHCSFAVHPKQDWPAGTPPEAKLRAFVQGMMGVMFDHTRPAWEIELVMREMARPTKACEELAASFIGPKFAMLNSIIDEFVPESMTPVERHLLAFSVVGQCLVYRFHRPIGRLLVGNAEYESYTTEQLAEHVANVSIAGIRAAAAACAAKGDSP